MKTFVITFCLLLITINAEAQQQFLGSWTGKFIIGKYKSQAEQSFSIKFDFQSFDTDTISGAEVIYNPKDSVGSQRTGRFRVLYNRTQGNARLPYSFSSPGETSMPGYILLSISETMPRIITGHFVPREKNEKMIISVRLLNTSADRTDEIVAIKTKMPLYQNNTPMQINADKLYSMHEGLAVISKGNVYAVVNYQGKVIIPFGKYVFDKIGGKIEAIPIGFRNGTCVVASPTDPRMLGLINSKGELIAACTNFIAQPADKEGWAQITDVHHKPYFMSVYGEKVAVPSVFLVQKKRDYGGSGGMSAMAYGPEFAAESYSGLVNISVFEKGISPGVIDGLYGYYDRSGKEIIKAQYKYAAPFSEGLACVSKYNEFRELKYGFINKKGETVIPFNYTKRPGNFSNGLAYVEPLSTDSYLFCFINKKGEILYKQKNAKPIEYFGNSREFEEGYFRMIIPGSPYANLKFIDVEGNDVESITKLKGRIKTFLNYNQYNYPYYKIQNGIQLFRYAADEDETKVAFLRLKDNSLVFTNYKNLEEFDLKSGLALYYDNQKSSGYIDSSGHLVMVMNPNASEF